MAPSRSPSQSRGRERSRTRSPTPRSGYSRSPSPRPRRRRYDSRSLSRSRSPASQSRRNRGNSRSRSRSRSRLRSHGNRGRSDSRDLSDEPNSRSTKIVVERLTKNVNERHLYEIFGEYGRIKDLDLPLSRNYGTNRGTAYILFQYEQDAEAAIAHMHEAQLDGATIHVSIVLPRRKLSPAPPTAKRGANIDPRIPFNGGRGGAPPGPFPGGGGSRRRPSPDRYGSRSQVYRPSSHSVSRSRSPGAAPSRGGGGRYRSLSRASVSSRSRSRSPRRRGGGGRFNDRRSSRSRSPSYDSYDGRSRGREYR